MSEDIRYKIHTDIMKVLLVRPGELRFSNNETLDGVISVLGHLIFAMATDPALLESQVAESLHRSLTMLIENEAATPDDGGLKTMSHH